MTKDLDARYVDEIGMPTSPRMLAHEFWIESMSSQQKAWVLRQIPERDDARLIFRKAISFVADRLLAFEVDGDVLRARVAMRCPAYPAVPKKALSRRMGIS